MSSTDLGLFQLPTILRMGYFQSPYTKVRAIPIFFIVLILKFFILCEITLRNNYKSIIKIIIAHNKPIVYAINSIERYTSEAEIISSKPVTKYANKRYL